MRSLVNFSPGLQKLVSFFSLIPSPRVQTVSHLQLSGSSRVWCRGTWSRACVWGHYSLCFRDEFVSIIPVSQEIRCLFIIYTDVMILKDSWEEVVYLSSDVQDIPHPARKPRESTCSTIQAKSQSSTVFPT